MTLIAIIAVLVGVALATALAVVARGYVRAAVARRGRRGGCPFENDDDEARPLVREVADVMRESGALVRAIGAALRPVPRAWRSLSVRPGVGPVVVLVPERRLTAASMAHLGRRLAQDLDASVHVEAASSRAAVDVRAARLADRLTALAAVAAGRPVLVVGHGAGGLVARRAVAVVRIGKVRLLTLATAHQPAGPPAARDPLVDRIEVVNVYSLHDTVVTPPARAYLAGAFNVALRDEGHFGVLFRARPYVVAREGLADLMPHAAAS